MNYGIAVINNGRPKVFKLWCASIDRLRSQFGNFDVVCISGIEDARICVEHDITHITQPNKPVSFKWNVAFEYLRLTKVEYSIICGSDDIISNELMSNIIANIKKGYDLIGINQIYFYGTYGVYKDKLYYLRRPSMLGVCKTISKRVLDEIDWKVCPQPRNYAIDGLIHKTIRPYVHSMAFAEGAVCDVKTRDNMNHITFWASKIKETVPSNLFTDYLSEQELKILKTL